MAWFSSGRLLNPVLDAVLVDTGPLPAGARKVKVIGSATVAAVFELQLRNAANTLTLKSQILAVAASSTSSICLDSMDISMADSERFRVIAVAAVTGSVSVSLDVA
jgi:hypothetical protein